MAQSDPQVHEGEFRFSRNWPPLSRMDALGIAVAGFGTLALIMIAVVSAGGEHGNYGWVTITRLLLATGMTLLNLAHVVGIFFFESVDYHGPFQRFFSRMSLIGTPLAVVVSLAVGLF